MIMCKVCNERPAIVFSTTLKDGKLSSEGYCLECAKKIGLPNMGMPNLEQLGIDENQLNELSKNFTELLSGLGSDGDFQFGGQGIAPPPEECGEMLEGMFEQLKGSVSDPEELEKGLQKMKDEYAELYKSMNPNGAEDKSSETSKSSDSEKKGKSDSRRRNQFDFSSLFSGNSKKSSKKDGKYLGTYCTDLTQKARNGELDPVVGRDREITRAMHILSRRTKNNPCLIGEPGVGKTAIAEGIAQKLVEFEKNFKKSDKIENNFTKEDMEKVNFDVPYNLLGKRIMLLDMTALVAGTQFRGQFESRCKGLIEEVKNAGNIILFIDEVHTIVRAGDSEGSMNAANIMKPALSRGEITVIGATTFSEYRKYIEKDSALERRFQPIEINEPNIDETVEIIKGVKSYYEDFHNVTVTDHIARVCAVLSERYINDRFLPDKAIDLLDEACTYACANNKQVQESHFLEVQKQRYLAQQDKLKEIDPPDYEKIAEISQKLCRIDERIKEMGDVKANTKVSEQDIASIIELWTGIPQNKIAETQNVKIKGLADELSKKVVGQQEAIKLVANAVKRTRLAITKRRRPASFIFVGPTGVGKTELVKVLGQTLFDSVDPIIRLDMSEYMEQYSVSKLIGSPPGYVGYDEAGQLTEKVRRKPYSVVLFDEIEKAHPDVMNILLQILDEGRLTDAQGRTVSFENTIIVMTSNAGSTDTTSGVGFNKTAEDITKERALSALRKFLRPEFLGRVDEIVTFSPLTEENFSDVAALMLEENKEPMTERGIELSYDKSVCDLIAKKAFSSKLGARQCRNVIRNEIEDKIADIILDKGDENIHSLAISVADDDFVIACD